MPSAIARWAGLLGFISLLLFVGCGSSHESKPDSDEPQTLRIDVQPSSFWVRRGGTLQVQVAILRSERMHEETVVLRATGLPEGVSADDVVVGPGGSTSASITFTASHDAPTGGPHVIQIEGRQGDEVSQKSVEIIIAGHPGELDTSFGDAGIVTMPVGWDGDIQFSSGFGGIYVLVWEGDSNYSIRRITSDGQVDLMFGGGGAVDVLGNGSVYCSIASSQADEFVLSMCGGGDAEGLEKSDLILQFVDSSGSAITSFGQNGTHVIRGEEGSVVGGFAAAFDRAGRLVVANRVLRSSAEESFQRLHRLSLTEAGRWEPDPEFGGHGYIDLEGTRQLNRLLALDNGGVLLAGARGSGAEGFVVRVQADGAVDQAFGVDGYLALDLEIRGAVAGDESIYLLAGRSELFGLDLDGNLDRSFGFDGSLDTGEGLIRSIARGPGPGLYIAKSIPRPTGGLYGFIQKVSDRGGIEPGFAERTKLERPEILHRFLVWIGFDAEGRLLAGYGAPVGEDEPTVVVARFWP